MSCESRTRSALELIRETFEQKEERTWLLEEMGGVIVGLEQMATHAGWDNIDIAAAPAGYSGNHCPNANRCCWSRAYPEFVASCDTGAFFRLTAWSVLKFVARNRAENGDQGIGPPGNW